MSDYQGGSFQTPPPPPGMTPPPPPPGMTPPPPPPQFGPEPIKPGSGTSSPWVYILIGCAAVAVIGIIALAGTCTYMGTKGSALFSSVMEMGKVEYMKMLTPDHTEAQKEDFGRHYDLLGEKISEHGIIKFSTEYGEVFQEFSEISQDGKITVRESTDWSENFDSAIGND